jgi:dTMP kinase
MSRKAEAPQWGYKEGMSGLFIAIEGLDGCGSTTQIGLLADRLPNVHRTAEPSQGPVGLLIRQALRHEIPLSDATFPNLFAADRLDHLQREIEPALTEGKMVITDRYYGSSMAYQSQIVPLDKVMALNADFRSPDLTLFLDISPENALERINARGEALEHFESLARLQDISASFAIAMALLQQNGEKIVRVDALGSVEEVHERMLAAIRQCLP